MIEQRVRKNSGAFRGAPASTRARVTQAVGSNGRRYPGDPRERRRAFESTGARTGAVPSLEQAFEAFVTLIAYASGTVALRTVYHQENLPPDCTSRDQYLRRHRELRRAGVDGAWMRGKIAACAPEAWATDVRKPSLPAIKVGSTPVSNLDEQLDVALGIRTKM